MNSDVILRSELQSEGLHFPRSSGCNSVCKWMVVAEGPATCSPCSLGTYSSCVHHRPIVAHVTTWRLPVPQSGRMPKLCSDDRHSFLPKGKRNPLTRMRLTAHGSRLTFRKVTSCVNPTRTGKQDFVLVCLHCLLCCNVLIRV